MSIIPLLTEQQIVDRISKIGPEVRSWYGDEPILCVAILKGSIFFLADLVRTISGDVELSFMAAKSHVGTESTGSIQITQDLDRSITGRHVVIVEDIADTGLTLSHLCTVLRARGPKSLRVVTLLDKPSRRCADLVPDLIGFQIPEAFVVGYGLDLDERFRNIPFVAVYDPQS